MKNIYLDNAASTPLDPQVLEVMQDSMRNDLGNPSSIHNYGRQARTRIEKARKNIAHHLNASIGEIFFTSGGTESNNTAIKCAVRDLGVRKIVSTRMEHHCVLHSLERVRKTDQVTVDFVQLDDCGRIDAEHLDRILKETEEGPVLVSIMHANNEIGTMQDLQQISDICHQHGAYLHSDTVQTLGHYPLDLDALDIHFLSGSAHKFHGPKGTGLLYMNAEALVEPLLDGGAQERNVRAGTENIYGIAGMATALDIAMDKFEEDQSHILQLKQRLRSGLLDIDDRIDFIGGRDDESLYTVLNVLFPPHQKNDMFLMYMDLKGIAVSGGSACSSGADQGSHVIQAIRGSTDGNAVRFSFSRFNTAEEVDATLHTIEEILKS